MHGYMIEPGASVWLSKQMKSFSNLVPRVFSPGGGKMRDPGNEVGVFLRAWHDRLQFMFFPQKIIIRSCTYSN